MSLTREQWVEMWNSVKKIEKIAESLKRSLRTPILNEVQDMKDKIESVIGQME